MEETRPGRTGDEILRSIRERMKGASLNGAMYSHPVGLQGHGAGPLIGLWDMQDGVAGRGDAKVVPSMWYSVEHQVTTRVDEWEGQPVRMAQEEDMIISADGTVRWAHKSHSGVPTIRSHSPPLRRTSPPPLRHPTDPASWRVFLNGDSHPGLSECPESIARMKWLLLT